MKTIFPSAYMTVRVPTIFNILESIPLEKASYFEPAELKVYEEQSGLFKKQVVLNHMINLDISTRINGHYKINLENEDVKGLYIAIKNKDDNSRELYLRKLILRFDLIKRIIDEQKANGVINIHELKAVVLTHHNLKKVHREQLKFIFSLLHYAGIGEYKQYHGRFIFKHGVWGEIQKPLFEDENIKKENTKSFRATDTTIKSGNLIFVIEVKKNNGVIMKKEVNDKQILQQLFTKEELIDMLIS